MKDVISIISVILVMRKKYCQLHYTKKYLTFKIENNELIRYHEKNRELLNYISKKRKIITKKNYFLFE